MIDLTYILYEVRYVAAAHHEPRAHSTFDMVSFRGSWVPCRCGPSSASTAAAVGTAGASFSSGAAEPSTDMHVNR